MSIGLQRFSYRFAEQVLNEKLSLKQEIEGILLDQKINISTLTRPRFNKVLKDLFVRKKWESQPSVFNEPRGPSAKMDFMKERVGVEVGFEHLSFIGIDLFKFQTSSYSELDKIDVGVCIATTRNFRKKMVNKYNHNWKGSLAFEKVVRYLPHF